MFNASDLPIGVSSSTLRCTAWSSAKRTAGKERPTGSLSAGASATRRDLAAVRYAARPTAEPTAAAHWCPYHKLVVYPSDQITTRSPPRNSTSYVAQKRPDLVGRVANTR